MHAVTANNDDIIFHFGLLTFTLAQLLKLLLSH